MGFVQSSVTHDRKAVIINGLRKILISGSIHYLRNTPDMWEDLIQKAKDGGLDVVETSFSGTFMSLLPAIFEDRYDLVRFIKTVQ